MGDEPSMSMNMASVRVKHTTMCGMLAICALAVIAGALTTTQEASLSEATDLIQNMKKKGVTEADCKDFAKTTCKEVLSEVKKDQKFVDSLTSGIECDKRGVKSVEIAVKRYRKLVKRWTVAKKKVTKWASQKISLSVKTLISLKVGRKKCASMFANRSYRTIYHNYHRAKKYERNVHGWVVEAKKFVATVKRSQKKDQENCRCAVAKRHDTFWITINSKERRARQSKALAQCKMMQCVLNGTPVNNKKCFKKLPVLKNKKLYRLVKHAVSSKICQRRQERHSQRGEQQ